MDDARLDLLLTIGSLVLIAALVVDFIWVIRVALTGPAEFLDGPIAPAMT